MRRQLQPAPRFGDAPDAEVTAARIGLNRLSVRSTHTGSIKSIVTDRGFAFINDAAGQDIFLHFRDVIGGAPEFHRLQVGNRVEFVMTSHNGRPSAKRVRRA